MKIKNTREYFLTLNQKLSYLGALKGSKFTFTIVKNRETIKPIIKKVSEMTKMSDAYKEFDNKRIEINEKYCEKDKDGKPTMENERYTIIESNRVKFDKEIKDLMEEYKDAVKERNEQKETLTKFLKEEIELEFKPIPLSIIPDDINVDEMEILEPLVQE